MNARQRQKTSADSELQQKRAELASLRERHAEARAELQQLRAQIARFESSYHEAMGERIAELERIEAEIARLSGYADWAFHREEASPSDRDAHCQGDTADGATPAAAGRGETVPHDLKSLYREVAKTIHPDLADAGPAQVICHELMSRANRAYAEEDRQTLQEILRNWRRSAVHGEGAQGGSGSELSELVRQIARERQEIRAINAKIEELQGSYVWRFKKRVEANRAIGINLFAEMAADADLEIARARRRLAAAKGEQPQNPPRRESKGKRELRFPQDACCGTIYLRAPGTASYHNWKLLGPAQGVIAVEVDQAVRLDVKERGQEQLARLRELNGDDFHSLYLYRICDGDLESIAHLTGLEELYLSGKGLTDAGLRRLSSFSKLKRIYLYHTEVTDDGLSHLLYLPSLIGITSSGNGISYAGLAALRRAAPGVKTVSFNWKR